MESRIVSPAFPRDFVRLEDGTRTRPPEGWALLPPGDAGLTRRVKKAGPTWTVKAKKGRRVISLGVWAPAETIDRERQRLQQERETPQYAARQAAAAARRDRKQAAYVDSFRESVLQFLDFAPAHAAFAQSLADAVTAHATPVGSGTVARTKRIPIERRAEAAVIAWMRHQTTAYDKLKIKRIKGERRRVRAQLAERSRQVLRCYREGGTPAGHCPLAKAIAALTVDN